MDFFLFLDCIFFHSEFFSCFLFMLCFYISFIFDTVGSDLLCSLFLFMLFIVSENSSGHTCQFSSLFDFHA